MNKAQRLVIGFGAVLATLMLLVPPFHEVSVTGRVGGSLGYYLVGLAPRGGQINLTALALQFGGLAVAVTGLWWAFRQKSLSKNTGHEE